MAKAAHSKCILFPCCPLAGGKDMPAPPPAAERVEGSHISGRWQIPVPLVTKTFASPFCLVHSRGTRPSRDAQGKGRDIRGNCEVRQGTNVIRTLCTEMVIPCTLHSPGSDLDGTHYWKPSSTDPLLKGREQWDDKPQTAV